MQYFTTTALGPKQTLTPEGFLICHDVPIARTGQMLYAAGEVPVSPGPDGIISIERTADDLFAPETMASFEGKPVTIDHPAEDVTPANWKEHAYGYAQNVRRGSGVDTDLMIADLLIMDKAAIKSVRDDQLREVSCGYDADYEEIAPGRGRQRDIFGNHVALVETGRCGFRCAIGDKAMKWIDRLRAAFKSQNEADFEKTLTESATATQDAEAKTTDASTADALAKVLDRLDALDKRVRDLEATPKDPDADGDTKDAVNEDEEDEEKKKSDKTSDSDEDEDEDEDEKKKKSDKTGDSAQLRDEITDTVARAEILSPGLHLPTLDAKSSPAKTQDALCGLRRKALQKAFTGDKRDALKPLMAGVDLKTATCDAIRATFVGASEIVRRANNAAQTQVTFDASKSASNIATTISNINRRNAEFWARN